MQWYGNTRAQLAEEYEPYEQDSVFLALANEHDDVLGTMRFLVGAHKGLKTIDDMERAPWCVDSGRSAAAAGLDLHRVWDVATMGLRPGIRDSRTQLSFALYHGFVTTMRMNRVHAIVAIIDERVRRLMSAAGLATLSMPGTEAGPYLGSGASTPVYAHVAGTLDRQRREFPDAYRLITLGVGLDGVSVPTSSHFRLESWLLTQASPPRDRQLESTVTGRLR